MAKDFNKEDGVWRTIGGRKVFIRKGQNLADAMIESGKFKGQKNKPGMRESYRKEKEKDYKEQDELYEKYKNANDENVKDEARKYMNKVSDNNEKYEDTYEKRAEKENRQARVDALRGDTEPLREQYRQEGKEDLESIEEWSRYKERNQKALNRTTIPENAQRNLAEIESANKEIDKAKAKLDENADKLLNKDKKENNIKNVDDYLNRDKTKDKLNYNENTKEDNLYAGTFSKKSNVSERDVKDLFNQLNDEGSDFMFNEARIEDGKLKANVSVFMPGDEEDGGGLTEREIEIPVSKDDDYNSLEEKMRDWQSRHSTPDTFYDDDVEEKKSTNETMNNAIREKASKKNKVEQDLPKHTEIKEQGTSNRKEVSENIQAHILDYYDSPEDFIEQMDTMDWLPNNWKRGEQLAEDGSYEIYYEDQRKFLDDLKINPKGKDFGDDKVFNMYKSLIGRESAKLYDRLKKNAYKQYMKDHPLSRMSFDDFKDMKK